MKNAKGEKILTDKRRRVRALRKRRSKEAYHYYCSLCRLGDKVPANKGVFSFSRGHVSDVVELYERTKQIGWISLYGTRALYSRQMDLFEVQAISSGQYVSLRSSGSATATAP